MYGKNYAAIEFAENNCFHLLLLEKQKNTLVISKRITTDSLPEIITAIKGQKHVFLVFNNEKVLSKNVPVVSKNNTEVLQTAFPNIVISDFYFQILATTKKSFISLIRKESVDEAVVKLKEQGISVIDFSLGNLGVASLVPVFKEKSLSTSNAKITLDEAKIATIEKGNINDSQYEINSLEVSNNETLSLAGIISYYLDNPISSIHNELVNQYKNKHFFNLGLKVGLGFILSILLINFLFFNHYRGELEIISGELEIANTYKKQLTQIQEQVTLKQQLVESVNGASATTISMYIDEIGETTPKTVLLSLINYQPVIGIQKKEKPINFSKQLLVIEGTSKNDEDFSDWINNLEQKEWVDAIEIKTYGKGKKNTSSANFEFLIQTQ